MEGGKWKEGESTVKESSTKRGGRFKLTDNRRPSRGANCKPTFNKLSLKKKKSILKDAAKRHVLLSNFLRNISLTFLKRLFLTEQDWSRNFFYEEQAKFCRVGTNPGFVYVIFFFFSPRAAAAALASPKRGKIPSSSSVLFAAAAAAAISNILLLLLLLLLLIAPSALTDESQMPPCVRDSRQRPLRSICFSEFCACVRACVCVSS